MQHRWRPLAASGVGFRGDNRGCQLANVATRLTCAETALRIGANAFLGLLALKTADYSQDGWDLLDEFLICGVGTRGSR